MKIIIRKLLIDTPFYNTVGKKMLLKNIFDFILALILSILLFPLMILVGVLVRLNLGKGIIFSQQRPGKDEKIFTIYKFRTMSEIKYNLGESLSDEERLTRFGAFLRSTSLDELPQLFNVLKGEMSFIGPRALLIEYLPRYTDNQKTRHNVKPGLTGWAQVNGRNAISWEEKFEYDLWYVEHRSFVLDLKIILKTIKIVIMRSGVSASDHVSMPFFEGSNSKGKNE